MKVIALTFLLIWPWYYAEAFEVSAWDKVREKGLEPGKTYDISSGTGFFVSPGHIITNEHVVQHCLNISIRGAVPPSSATIEAVDKVHDLALLSTDARSSRIAYIRANNGLNVNDPLFIIGYPLEHASSGDYVLNKANLISLDKPINQASQIEFTAAIEHGNSGGPLIDYAGNVVGVIQAKKNYYYVQEGQSISLNSKPFKISGIAIGLGLLKNFLINNNIYFQSSSSYDIFGDGHPDEKAKDFIVNVHCVRPLFVENR